MARLPYQVLVILFLKIHNEVKYCIFERKCPKSQVQFIAGGGEDAESVMETVKREVYEESGIIITNCIQLTSTCYIPTNIFTKKQRKSWGNTLFVIPEYTFGVEVKSETISISDEHIGFKWVTYEKAIEQLTWDSNKTALYELHCTINKSCPKTTLK